MCRAALPLLPRRATRVPPFVALLTPPAGLEIDTAISELDLDYSESQSDKVEESQRYI